MIPGRTPKAKAAFWAFYREPSSALVHDLTLRHESVGSERD